MSSIGESGKAKNPGKVEALIAKIAAEMIEKHHYSRLEFDNLVSSRLYAGYFDSLDPDRYFFYADDFNNFAHYKTLLDDFLPHGHINFAYEVYNVFISRFEERLNFIKTRLKLPFDFSKDDEFISDRSQQSWCKNKKELDNQWRLRLKNDILNRMLADINEKEKKDNKSKSEDKRSMDTSKNKNLLKSPLLSDHSDLFNTAKDKVRKAYEKHFQRINDKANFEILEIFLSSLAQVYDPHSAYMAPMTKANFDISMKHSLEGIGARLMADEGYVRITEIIPGGPADRGGQLKSGDLIIAVAQENEEPVDIMNMSLQRVVSLIRGPKGSRVSLTVVEAGKDLNFPKKIVEVIRDKINLTDRGATIEYLNLPSKELTDSSESPGVEPESSEDRKVGVISLRSFYTDFDKRNRGVKDYTSSTQDVLKLIQEAKQDQVEGLVMDLRSNSGGSLEEAVSLVGLFFSEGPVVQVRYGSGNESVLYDKDAKVYYDGPLVVLVDRYSASAAEIFAAAIQDYGRGIIIGESSTHGKGTVQTLHSLNKLVGNRALLSSIKPGSLKITTAKFYRITGGSTQKKGVTPDIIIPSFRDKLEIGESFLPNALAWDQIELVEFIPTHDRRGIVPLLQERFENRTKSYDWYARLIEDVERYDTSVNRKSLPLNMVKRFEFEEEKHEWFKKIKEYKLSKPRKNSKDKRDQVLNESLLVLSDLIAIQGNVDKTSSDRVIDQTDRSEKL